MNINNVKQSLCEKLQSQEDLVNFLDPNAYLKKKLNSQKVANIQFDKLVSPRSLPIKALTSHNFFYKTCASLALFYVYHFLIDGLYQQKHLSNENLVSGQIRGSYYAIVALTSLLALNYLGISSFAETPYDYDENKAKLIAKSRNAPKIHQNHLFSSKPLSPSLLPLLLSSPVQESVSITKTQVKEGICNGMSWWFIVLFLYSQKMQPDLIQRAEKIAYLFKDGAPKQSVFLQTLFKTCLPQFLYEPIQPGNALTIQQTQLKAEEAQQAESLIYTKDVEFMRKTFNVECRCHVIFNINQQSSLPSLESLEKGIYKISLHDHAMVLIKEEKRTLLYDPNGGLFVLENQSFEQALNQFCKVYRESGRHTYGMLQKIELNSFCFGTNPLFADKYMDSYLPTYANNPFSQFI